MTGAPRSSPPKVFSYSFAANTVFRKEFIGEKYCSPICCALDVRRVRDIVCGALCRSKPAEAPDSVSRNNG